MESDIEDCASPEALAQLREQTTESFKNLFWTRIVTLDLYAAD